MQTKKEGVRKQFAARCEGDWPLRRSVQDQSRTLIVENHSTYQLWRFDSLIGVKLPHLSLHSSGNLNTLGPQLPGHFQSLDLLFWIFVPNGQSTKQKHVFARVRSMHIIWGFPAALARRHVLSLCFASRSARVRRFKPTHKISVPFKELPMAMTVIPEGTVEAEVAGSCFVSQCVSLFSQGILQSCGPRLRYLMRCGNG